MRERRSLHTFTIFSENSEWRSNKTTSIQRIYIGRKGYKLSSEDSQTRKMDHEEIKGCLRRLLTDYLLAHVIFARFLFFIVRGAHPILNPYSTENTKIILRLRSTECECIMILRKMSSSEFFDNANVTSPFCLMLKSLRPCIRLVGLVI